jgi:hypothetical protein
VRGRVAWGTAESPDERHELAARKFAESHPMLAGTRLLRAAAHPPPKGDGLSRLFRATLHYYFCRRSEQGSHVSYVITQGSARIGAREVEGRLRLGSGWLSGWGKWASPHSRAGTEGAGLGGPVLDLRERITLPTQVQVMSAILAAQPVSK